MFRKARLALWLAKVFWAYARDGEPFFLIRGRDRFAPYGIEGYLRRVRDEGVKMRGQARAVDRAYGELLAWQEANWSRTHEPTHEHLL